MELTNKLVEKYGADKLLHCFMAGWLVSLSSNFEIGWMVFVTIIVIVLSIFKECCWDDRLDWKDLYAAILGIAISWIFYCIA